MTFDPTAFQTVQIANFAQHAATLATHAAAETAMAFGPQSSGAFSLDTDDPHVSYRLMVAGGAATLLALTALPGSAAAQETRATTGARDPFCEAQDATMARMQHEKNQFDSVVFALGIGLALVFAAVPAYFIGRRRGKRIAAAQQQQAPQNPSPQPGPMGPPRIGE